MTNKRKRLYLDSTPSVRVNGNIETPINGFNSDGTFSTVDSNGNIHNNNSILMNEVIIKPKQQLDYSELYPLSFKDVLNTVRNVAEIAQDKLFRLSDPIFNNKLLKQGFKQYLEDQDNIYKSSYYNATEPYNFNTKDYNGDNVINVYNGVSGARDRLEMLGMVKEKDGKYYYLDENGNHLSGCAANANRINQMLGKPTAGNAWTRHGIYGDSAIVVNPNVTKKGLKPKGFIRQKQPINWQNADYVEENIDKHDLKTGDIVDMGWPASENVEKAFNEGDYNRGNTHTGTILRVPQRDSKNRLKTYVIHNMGDNMLVEPIGNLLGNRIKHPYITAIRRPGTAKHPYSNMSKYNKINKL